MAWSAENATKAYLTALSGGAGGNRPGAGSSEPDVAEFISAMAAGMSARLMVEVCAGAASGPTTLALAAAAQQTGGRVVCILPTAAAVQASTSTLADAGCGCSSVELVASTDPVSYLLRELSGADFVLVDCRLEGSGRVFAAAHKGAARAQGGVVVGYGALRMMARESECSWGGAQLLPIGDGLRVSRVKPEKRSRWVVRVDECTGEEHVFRVVDRAVARSRWVVQA